jgi:multicomponent Na+:H+ antiporter subunit E
VRSNFAVARVLLRRTIHVAPEIVTVDARHLPPVSQATLANSITLTPGTVTLDVNDGDIEVHCLTREIAADLRRGEIVARATVLAGKRARS